MRSVSDVLRERREELDLDLAGIGETLRIKPAYLAALEQGRWSELPGPAYASGFVRAYANHLGLDPEKVLQRFRAESSDFRARPDLALPVPLAERSLPGLAVLLVALILALCGYGTWYYLSTGDRTRPERVAAVPSSLQVPAPVPAPARPTDAQARPAAIAPAAIATPAPEAASRQGPTMATGLLPASAGALQPGSGFAAPPPAAPSPPSTPAPEFAAPAAAPTVGGVRPPAPPVQVAAAPPPPVPAPAPAAPPAPTPTPAAVLAPAPPPQIAVSPQAAPAPASTPAAIPAPAPPPVQSAAAPAAVGPGSAAQPGAPGTGRVAIKALADCWIQVRAPDQSIVFSRVLKAGEVYKVPAKPGLFLRTGNAGVLEIAVDGKTAPSVGGVGILRRNIVLEPDALLGGTAVQG